MAYVEVIVRAEVRPGHLEEFTAQAAEIVRITREQDSRTLRCDWFLDEEGARCEVHELFLDEQGLIEHKMNTMDATVALFRDSAFDHHATIYGQVSPEFVALATERMGAPTVFAFAQGLESPAPVPAEASASSRLEVIARLRVRPGQLERFTTQVGEIVRLTREKDTHTLRYDWFHNDDETEFEVHEVYVTEEGLVEHNEHVVEARETLFRECAFDHRMSVYGEISAHLAELFDKHAGGVSKFALVQGLDHTARV